MFVNTKGFVIRKTKFSDNSLIIKCYTEQLGTVSFIIKNAFSQKNKYLNSVLATLNILELTFNYNKNRQLLFLKEAKIYYKWKLINTDLVRNSLFFLYNEVLLKILFNYGEDIALFNFIEKELLLLDSPDSNITDIHLRFLTKLANVLGFAPTKNFSTINCCFSIKNGMFCTQNSSADGELLSKEASFMLNAFLNTNDEEYNKTAAGNFNTRIELLNGLLKYFKIHNYDICRKEALNIITQLNH